MYGARLLSSPLRPFTTFFRPAKCNNIVNQNDKTINSTSIDRSQRDKKSYVEVFTKKIIYPAISIFRTQEAKVLAADGRKMAGAVLAQFSTWVLLHLFSHFNALDTRCPGYQVESNELN